LDGILCLLMNQRSWIHDLADLEPEFSCSGHKQNVKCHISTNISAQGCTTLDPYKNCATLDGIICLLMNWCSWIHDLADLEPEISCSGHEQKVKCHISTNMSAQGCTTLDPSKNPATLNLWYCWKIKVSKILQLWIYDIAERSKFPKSDLKNSGKVDLLNKWWNLL
jgi:hypothetical protein